MPPLPSRADLKTYLGLTTNVDDGLIDALLPVGLAQAERDTGRTFASGSNSTTVYSSGNEALVSIHDRPYVDPSRTVSWNGVALIEGTNAWFLPDRRNPAITISLQLYVFTDRADAYKADPQWFDKNLDRWWARGALPNDITITGVSGHPFPSADVTGAILVLDAWLYWRAKSGASGTVSTVTGEAIQLSDTPPEYQAFVRDWRVRNAVASVG